MRRANEVVVLLGSTGAAAVRLSAGDREIFARCESVDTLAVELRTRRGVRRVSLVLDTSVAQIRVIDGLPSTSDARALRAVLTAAPYRFFLRTAVAPLVSHVRVLAPGAVKAALCDSQLVEHSSAALRQQGIRVRRVAAAECAAVMMPPASPDAGAVVHLASDALYFPKVPAQSRGDGPLRAWKPRGGGALVAAVLVVACAIAPAWRLHASRTSQGRPDLEGTVAREVAQAAHLDSLRQPLSALRERAAIAPHPLLLLDAITSILPRDARIFDFDVDSTGAQLTVSTASLQTFLRRLERLSTYQVALGSDISADSGSTGGEHATVILRARRATAPSGAH